MKTHFGLFRQDPRQALKSLGRFSQEMNARHWPPRGEVHLLTLTAYRCRLGILPLYFKIVGERHERGKE